MSKLTFWGVQGTCPGKHFQSKIGHNTTCVSIELGNQLIIFDSGTGIRCLAQQLSANNYDTITIILTHSHWDHIQGFPLFSYLFSAKEINIFCPINDHSDALLSQLNGRNFPLSLSDISCKLNKLNSPDAFKSITGLDIEYIRTNHQGTCYGYRVKGD